MRTASYIALGLSAFLFVLFLLIWSGGLLIGQTLGVFRHLLLPAMILPVIGFVAGLILLIVSFAKKPSNAYASKFTASADFRAA